MAGIAVRRGEDDGSMTPRFSLRRPLTLRPFAMKHTLWIVAAGLVPSLGVAQARQEIPPVIVPLPASRLPLKHVPEPTSADITARDLMTRLYIFADDSMEGREAGTAGNVRGTTYIAHEVERIGL